MQEELKALRDQLAQYDWFYDVRAEDRRYVVYVKRMVMEQNTVIPFDYAGHQVVVHWASELTVTRSQFVNEPETTNYHHLDLSLDYDKVSMDDDGDEIIIDDLDLVRELDRLEDICGSEILQDIFYEIHDKHNAITNVSEQYPEVARSMKELYDTYGFDVIYDELDRCMLIRLTHQGGKR